MLEIDLSATGAAGGYLVETSAALNPRGADLVIGRSNHASGRFLLICESIAEIAPGKRDEDKSDIGPNPGQPVVWTATP